MRILTILAMKVDVFYDDGCDEIEFDDHDGDTRLSRFAL